MDDSLKQRLIGALVLIALAVIFIPVFFDRDRIDPLDHQTRIPIAPIVESIDIKKPVNNIKVEPAKPPKFLFSPREESSVDTDIVTAKKADKVDIKNDKKTPLEAVKKIKDVLKVDKPSAKVTKLAVKEKQSVLDAKGMPVSWVLQVASFSEKERAESLQKKLNKEGYQAYIETVPTPNGSRSRLFVGPKLDKAKLEKIQKAIEKKYKLKALILKFEA